MENTNYEGGLAEKSSDKKITLTPEIVFGKMKINLDTLEEETIKEKIIIESHKIPVEFGLDGDIEIDLKEFTGDLSGFFQVTKADDGGLEIVLINKDGGEVFKRKINSDNLKIELIGSEKEHLDIKIKPPKISIEERDLSPGIDLNEEDL